MPDCPQPGWPDYVANAANVYQAVYEQAFKHLYKIGLIEILSSQI